MKEQALKGFKSPEGLSTGVLILHWIDLWYTGEPRGTQGAMASATASAEPGQSCALVGG